jgi:hypothetical protein
MNSLTPWLTFKSRIGRVQAEYLDRQICGKRKRRRRNGGEHHAVNQILVAMVFSLIVVLSQSLRAEDAPPQSVPWGISSSASSERNHAEWFGQMSAAGVRMVRLFPEWRGLESGAGKWNWQRADRLVQSAKENKMRISGLLFGAAPGTKDRGHAFPMKDLDRWSAYTAAVVEHYKDQIHDWEVWNEGNAGFNDAHNTTADYAALVSAAYDAAKKADAKARIGMSVASFDAAYLDQAILAQAKNGKANHFDYLCIHPYETLDGIKDVDGEIKYLWMGRMLRDALKSDAPEKADAEIWITEVGMPVGKKVTEADAAKAVVKSYVMAIAQGISRVMWFEGRDPTGEQGGFGLIDRQAKPRMSYGSFKMMTAALGQTPKYLGWLSLGKEGRGYGFVFEGATTPVLVAWMPAKMRDDATLFTADVQVTDSLSNEAATLKAGETMNLTDTPVFITGLPADLLARAKNNVGENFPWGGDYSAAKTVSIQLSSKTQSNGIMQLGETPMPVHQFDDGSSGAVVRNNQIAPFYIHPSFANIKTRDYYIRLTLRRIGEGNVGMNFAYEIADTKGQNGPMRNSGGWYSAGPGMGWQTKTWHVTDACFAKMWGYDINFKPEKSVPFVIGKVEVSTEPLKD